MSAIKTPIIPDDPRRRDDYPLEPYQDRQFCEQCGRTREVTVWQFGEHRTYRCGYNPRHWWMVKE